MANWTSFIPNPDRPPFMIDVPFTVVEDVVRVVEPVWQRLLTHIPTSMVGTYQTRLRRLRGIRFESNVSSSFTQTIPRGFSRTLADAGIPHFYEEYAGSHSNKVVERIETKVLPFFSRMLHGELPRIQSATTDLGATAVGQRTTLAIGAVLDGPVEATGDFPELSLDLSALGLASVSLQHEGQGVYTYVDQVTPRRNAQHRLEILLDAGGEGAFPFITIPLEVWPSADRTLFTDQEAPEWLEPNIFLDFDLDPQATAQVFSGETSLGLQAGGRADFVFTWEPAAPLTSFGYSLRFAFHPGDVGAPEDRPPAFQVFVSGFVSGIGATKPGSIELLDGSVEDISVDLRQQEWQVVVIPLEVVKQTNLIQSISFRGSLKGTFYLDDIRLVPQTPPQTDTAVLETHQDTEPADFILDQNYPNPFNSGTVIRFALPQSQTVALTVYNLAGQQVATLVEGVRATGTYAVQWNGRDDQERDLASGLYFYRLQAGDRIETRKLLLLR